MGKGDLSCVHLKKSEKKNLWTFSLFSSRFFFHFYYIKNLEKNPDKNPKINPRMFLDGRRSNQISLIAYAAALGIEKPFFKTIF